MTYSSLSGSRVCGLSRVEVVPAVEGGVLVVGRGAVLVVEGAVAWDGELAAAGGGESFSRFFRCRFQGGVS
jgi:hypothetical protein